MLPRSLLPAPTTGRVVVPRYLDERDHPWLGALLDEYRRFAGRPRRLLDQRLTEPLRVGAPRAAVVRARHVLDRACRAKLSAGIAPRAVRAALFAEGAGGVHRERALDAAAAQLEMTRGEMLARLFADLPSEREHCAPPSSLGPSELALRTNLALAQGLVAASTRVEVRARGNARDLVRHARLRGLICTVRADADGAVWLELSGPLSLFRHTTVYGRALASLLPRLPWCDEFRLEATCMLSGGIRALVIQTGDPIFPANEPKRFDSKLEARFARDFAKRAPDWDLVREPEPVRVGETIVFPDFELRHRRQLDRRWTLEIVGFWTESYLGRKLAHLRQAGIENLILCIDEDRACAREDLPTDASIVRFRRSVDVERVMDVIGG